MSYDVAVDFMDMTNDRRLFARLKDARPAAVVPVGGYLVVGCEDADPAVARVLSIDPDRVIKLEVLRGPVESHSALVSSSV